MSDRTPTSPTNNGMLRFELPRPTVTLLSEKLPTGVMVLVVPPEQLQPEFIRLPEEGEKCPVTGLSRSRVVSLLEEAGGKINARVLRKRGATRGITLIDRRSLVEYINGLPAYGSVATNSDAA